MVVMVSLISGFLEGYHIKVFKWNIVCVFLIEMSSTAEVMEAEKGLFITVYGIIIGISIANFDVFGPIPRLVIFVMTLVIALDFYIQWFRYYNDFPAKSLKEIFVHLFMAIVIVNLFLHLDDPFEYSLMLSMYWIVDLLWCIRVYLDYRSEMSNESKGMLIYFIKTDIILAVVFLIFLFLVPIYLALKRVILLIVWIGIRLYDELVVASLRV